MKQIYWCLFKNNYLQNMKNAVYVIDLDEFATH